MPNPGKYSFAWGGQQVGDDSWRGIKSIYDAKTVVELLDKFESPEFNRYNGLGFNTILGDNSGNIGYQLIMSIPERKDKTPFLGSRILDGTTTKFDWTDNLIPLKDLPRSLNPKKGYLVTANGR